MLQPQVQPLDVWLLDPCLFGHVQQRRVELLHLEAVANSCKFSHGWSTIVTGDVSIMWRNNIVTEQPKH